MSDMNGTVSVVEVPMGDVTRIGDKVGEISQEMLALIAKQQTELGVTAEMMELEYTWYGPGTEVGLERIDCDGVQVACFLRDTGHMPRCAAELDAYSNDEAEHEAYQLANPVSESNPADDKAQEAALKVVMEQELDTCDSDYKATVKLLQRATASVAEGKQRLSVLFFHAVSVRLKPNRARKHPIRRKDAIAELHTALWDTVSDLDEITTYVRHGAAMATLFGATSEKPIVGKDGLVRSKSTGEARPMPWTTITTLCPLVLRNPSDMSEEWHILPNMQYEVRELIAAIVADNLPRGTVQEAVAKLCAEHYRLEHAKNPANQAAKKESEKWQAKVEAPKPATPAAVTTTPAAPAGTVTVPVGTATETTTTPVATVVAPTVPTSLVKPVAPENDTETTDEQIGIMCAGSIMDDCNFPLRALQAQLHAMLQDGGLDDTETTAVTACLVHCARWVKVNADKAKEAATA